MSRCPICELKPMNCDCTDGDREAYDLKEEVTILREEIDKLKSELSAAEKRGFLAGRKGAEFQAYDYQENEVDFHEGCARVAIKFHHKTFKDWRNSEEYKSGAKADGK